MKKNILVIDNDPTAQEMVTTALKKGKYTVVPSLNFEDALRKLRQILPDLVLIDVLIPDMTGFEACRKIKKMFRPRPPHVIMMTGKLDAVDPVLARRMGADDFVVKTSDMAVLTQAVQKILSI